MAHLIPSLMQPSRIVILIMDDGVAVFHVTRKGVQLLDDLHWRSSDFSDKLAETLSKSGATSAVILNDTVDPHYRKEKIPIPTLLDKANIIKRRLSVAFPNFPIRASMMLKQPPPPKGAAKTSKEKQEKDAVKTELHLFAALPASDAFGKIVHAISKVDIQIMGYGLLPIESRSLLAHLVKNISKNKLDIEGSSWAILISQHHGGGLRQIVVRNDELALTRVTPVMEPDPTSPGAWAAEVSQEIQATLSYLSRFGYTPGDGLDIIAIGESEFLAPIESMMSVPCHFTNLPVSVAAAYLGLNIGVQNDQHHADIIHAGWTAKKIALELPLVSRELISLQQPRRVALAFMLASAVSLAGVLGYATDIGMRYYGLTTNLEVAQADKKKIDEIYYEELKRKEKMGIDVPLIKGSLAVSRTLKDVMIDPLPLLESVSKEMQDIRLDKFEFSNDGPEVLDKAYTTGQPQTSRTTNLTLYISFSGTIEPKAGNQEIDKLVERLNNSLNSQGYLAEVTKQLQDLTYTGVIKREFGVTGEQRKSEERYKAEVVIKKVAKNG